MAATMKKKVKSPPRGDGKITAEQEELVSQQPGAEERVTQGKAERKNGLRTNAEPAKPGADEPGAGEEDGVGELEGKYLRLRAEYDNHIKRTNREKNELIMYAGSHTILKMLPILDDLRRTVDHAIESNVKQDDPVLQGVEMILEKFTKLLEAEGVKVVESVGQTFDPELHEALMSRPSKEHPEGIVIEEFEPAYKYRDKVIRHAKVVVSG